MPSDFTRCNKLPGFWLARFGCTHSCHTGEFLKHPSGSMDDQHNSNQPAKSKHVWTQATKNFIGTRRGNPLINKKKHTKVTNGFASTSAWIKKIKPCMSSVGLYHPYHHRGFTRIGRNGFSLRKNTNRTICPYIRFEEFKLLKN